MTSWLRWNDFSVLMLGPQLSAVFPTSSSTSGTCGENFYVTLWINILPWSLLRGDRAAGSILLFQMASMLLFIFALLSTIASHAFMMVDPKLEALKLHGVMSSSYAPLWWQEAALHLKVLHSRLRPVQDTLCPSMLNHTFPLMPKVLLWAQSS